MTENAPKTPYQTSIFDKPFHSRFFSRFVFYSFNRIMERLLTANDGKALFRGLLLLPIMVGLLAGLITFTAADPFLVFGDSGYEQPSEIYAVNQEGKYVPIAEFYRQSRKVIKLSAPEQGGLESKIARAFIATEDNSFETNLGIDLRGILRAAIVNIMAGRVKEGASTISQQAARLRFLTNERSLLRKAREASLALLMNLKYIGNKEKIMELYLNEVPLGHGTIGVDAAAQFYFGKPVHKLSWGEAALIASLTTRPRDFSPLAYIDESRKKVRIVFRKFVETGVMSIQEAEKEYALLETNYYSKLNRSPNDSAFNRRLNLHPYASEYVKKMLPRKYKRMLYTGGLRIYTTIRQEHQAAAEAHLIPHLKKLTDRWRRPPFKHFEQFDKEMGAVYPITRRLFGLAEFRNQISREERQFQRAFIHELKTEFSLLNRVSGQKLVSAAVDFHHKRSVKAKLTDDSQAVQGSLISMRPHTGEITAVVGGSGFTSKNQLLRFIQSRRQPGSSFKPIVYASAIEHSALNPKDERKLTAATVLDDSPLQFVNFDQSEYSPENYTMSYDGPLRLRRGLELSKNIIAVRVYERMTWSRINPIAEKLLTLGRRKGFLPKEATVALGSYGVRPFDMARTYAVFASGGKAVNPYVISHITDPDGKMLVDFRPIQTKKERKQLIKPGTARIIVSMLEGAVQRGTGRGARIGGRRVAGKTGTSNRYTDAWFVGFTPKLVTAVNIGYDRARSLGRGGAGGNIAAPLWSRYVRKALEGEKPGKFSFPGSKVVSVPICKLSGKRRGPRCKEMISEYFHYNTVPQEQCDEHRTPGSRDSPLITNKPEENILGED